MRTVRPTRVGLVFVLSFTLAACGIGPSDDAKSTENQGPKAATGPGIGSQNAGHAPALVAAMQRDLGLSAGQVEALLAVEARAAQSEPILKEQLADAYAGAWLKKDGSGLLVGITDARLADLVRELDAEPVVVKHSLLQLNKLKGELDLSSARADANIHHWYVDVTTNTVIVHAANNSASIARFLGTHGQDVQVIASHERPHLFYDVRGGDEIILGRSALCSMGFAVQGGYVTAGHCGTTGTATQGSNWVESGVIRGSVFPGNDYAYIETNSSWNTIGLVNNYAGGTVAVAGSNVASVGSSVCRSGRTTGWRCGVIQAQNVTINYAQGAVYGATQTSTCAEGGDSGGSFISGDQAQGMTSGGSGNCTSGGTTFFFPVQAVLKAYNLSLKTTGGGGNAIVSRLNNKCIDVPSSNFVDGARLQMWTCNNTAAQQWTFTGGTLRAGGMCMDVANANPADGTPVQLVHCNGNTAQQFVLNGAGDLVSVLANKCVDISGWNQNDGAQLIIWPCHGGNNQKWFTR